MVALVAFVACSTSDGDGEARREAEDSASADTGDSAPEDTSTPTDSGETGETGEALVDADGDGAFTPADCDDANPVVYPGAYDGCDGVDQDCDGSAQGDGACGAVANWADLELAGWWEGTEPYMRFSAFGGPIDLEDGPAVLGSMSGWHQGDIDSDWGAMTVLAGTPGRPESPGPEAARGIWVASEYEDHLRWIQAAGDFNDDEHNDVWVVSTGQSGCCDGSAFLVLGPSDRWPKEGAYIRDVADGWWIQAQEDDNFGGDLDAGGDVDGDGLPDGVFLAWGSIWDGTGGSLHVIRGRTGPLPYAGSIADEITFWKSDGRVDDASWVRIGPDMDGDGAREIVFDAPDHGMGLVGGGDLNGAGGGILADWTTVLVHDGVGRGPEFPKPGAVPGDLDGDGVDELVLTYQNLPGAEGAPDGDESCYRFLSGSAALAAGTIAAGTVATACVDSYATGTEVMGDDVDGDDVRDLVVAWPSNFIDAGGTEHDNDYLSCILPSSRLALGGRVEVRDVSLCHTGAIGTTVDLDADGLSELVFAPSDAVTTYEQAGRVDVLPGFQIPWDDPTKW